MLLCPPGGLYLVTATCILNIGYPPFVSQDTSGLSPTVARYPKSSCRVTTFYHLLQWCMHLQVRASSRSNPILFSVVLLLSKSVAILSSGSDLLPTTESSSSNQRWLFYFTFGSIDCVRIHLIGWYNFKTLQRVPKTNKKRGKIWKYQRKIWCRSEHIWL